jgi:hypothetical protein
VELVARRHKSAAAACPMEGAPQLRHSRDGIPSVALRTPKPQRQVRPPGIVRHDRDWEACMADVLSEIRSSSEKRLRELEPLMNEHAQVRKALDALEGVGARAQGTVRPAARRERTATAAAMTGRGRPRGSGRRAQEVVAHVHKQPGITIAELANVDGFIDGYKSVDPHLSSVEELRRERPDGTMEFVARFCYLPENSAESRPTEEA